MNGNAYNMCEKYAMNTIKNTIRYLPLNAPNIRLHYPIYRVIFHFVLTSSKTRTLPVKNQKSKENGINVKVIDRECLGKKEKIYCKVKVTTTTHDNPCEKIFSTILKAH